MQNYKYKHYKYVLYDFLFYRSEVWDDKQDQSNQYCEWTHDVDKLKTFRKINLSCPNTVPPTPCPCKIFMSESWTDDARLGIGITATAKEIISVQF
jgi:hypothetical protein